jgi:hypothetical protein
MSCEPFLSVSTITRHRPEFIFKLATQVLAAAALFDPERQFIRFYISDSSEDDRTMKVLAPLAEASGGRLIVRRATSNFDTAEEHLYDLLKVVEGRYVWTLADDEILLPDAFGEIFALLRTHEPDIAILNPAMTSFDGSAIAYNHFVDDQFFPTSDEDIQFSYGDVVRKIGLTHLTCMMSAVICDRRKLLSAKWEHYLTNHAIYAHSMAQLEAFVRSPAVFTRRKIFLYRMDAPGTNNFKNFKKVSDARGFGPAYFWSSSIAIYLDWAVKQSILTAADVLAITEIHWDKRQFTLLNLITDNFINQITSGDVSQSDIRAMGLLMKYLPPLLRRCFCEMLELAELSMANARAVEELRMGFGSLYERMISVADRLSLSRSTDVMTA